MVELRVTYRFADNPRQTHCIVCHLKARVRGFHLSNRDAPQEMFAAVDLSKYDRVASWNHGGFCYILCAYKIVPPSASGHELAALASSCSDGADSSTPSLPLSAPLPTTGNIENIITDLLEESHNIGEHWLREPEPDAQPPTTENIIPEGRLRQTIPEPDEPRRRPHVSEPLTNKRAKH